MHKKLGRPAYKKKWRQSEAKPICPKKLAEVKARWKTTRTS